MSVLEIDGPHFLSKRDEESFFAWLRAIPGVVSIQGHGTSLNVTFRTKSLSDTALRDLLALHQRYLLPMHRLAQFASARNAAWFKSGGAYWHSAVFGSEA